ncbi:hypothetical protein [Butyrivibrio sp. FC2001]|uniref:hypothetical protein n=1 Tax=Butyrivibrio sp. FC2001 TaxID=1280671 RepID=UPI0004037569|nr:hypothetical protein [Butyrivibrio sp. FC2001]
MHIKGKEEKVIFLILIASIVVFAALWVVMNVIEARPSVADYSQVYEKALGDSSEYAYDFSGIIRGRFTDSIDGWIVRKGQPTRDTLLEVWIVARNREDGSWFRLPTEVNRRKQTAKDLGDGVYYTWSGVTAKWMTSVFSGKSIGEDYELFCYYKVGEDERLIPIEVK